MEPGSESFERAGHAMRWRAVQLFGAQGLSFVRFLVLAWLLPPEAFGMLAIATVALSVLLQLSNVGVIPALVQQRDTTPEQQNAAWTIGVLRSLFVAFVLILGAPAVARLFGEPAAAPIVQALALRPMFEAASSIGIARLTRELQFRELALMGLAGSAMARATCLTSTSRGSRCHIDFHSAIRRCQKALRHLESR